MPIVIQSDCMPLLLTHTDMWKLSGRCYPNASGRLLSCLKLRFCLPSARPSFLTKTRCFDCGGKLSLLSKIIPLIPEHTLYCEPFIGGAAVFFAKEKAKVEVINDINGEIVNFYEVLQNNFSALQKEIQSTLHSRKLHQYAQVIYQNPDMFDRIKRAWAVWALANMSFNNALNNGFSRSSDGKISRKIAVNRAQFTDELKQRISGVQIECRDALKIIRSPDGTRTDEDTATSLMKSNSGGLQTQ